MTYTHNYIYIYNNVRVLYLFLSQHYVTDITYNFIKNVEILEKQEKHIIYDNNIKRL